MRYVAVCPASPWPGITPGCRGFVGVVLAGSDQRIDGAALVVLQIKRWYFMNVLCKTGMT